MIIDDLTLVIFVLGAFAGIIAYYLIQHFRFLRRFYKENHVKKEDKK